MLWVSHLLSDNLPFTQKMQLNNADVVKKLIFRYLSVPLTNGITNIFIRRTNKNNFDISSS